MKTRLTLFILALLAVPLYAYANVHNPGTNVVNKGTVYMISTDGHLRPYTSAGAFLSYGFNSWSNVGQASTDDLSLPVGDFIPPRDGKIVCSDRGNDKGTCYLITNGKKAAFTSQDVFTTLGFNFKNALYGDVSFLNSTNDISNSNQAHVPGVLINDGGTIKLIGTTGTIGIPSMNTLQSWGYSLVDVVSANAADKAYSQQDILAPHTPGQLTWNSNSTISVTPAPIASTECKNLQLEYKSFNDKYNLTVAQSLSISTEFVDMIKVNNSDFSYAYQRVLSKKDSFSSLIQQFNKTIDDLPLLSFYQTSDMKQKFYSGSADYLNAYNSLLLSSKYANEAIGVPNNSYLVNAAKTAIDESSAKSKSATASLIAGDNLYSSMDKAYALAYTNSCPKQ